MKNFFLAAFLLLAGPLTALAQPALSNTPQPIPHFRSNGAENSGLGIKGGVNLSSLQGVGVKKMYDDVKLVTQFNVGVYAQFGVSNRFSIQPELLFQNKGFKSTGDILRNRANTSDSIGAGSTTKLSYISLPLMLVFNVFDNVAIQVGPQASYLVNVRNGSQTIEVSTYKFNTIDVGIAAGVEAKMEFLRFGARYDYSLTDLRTKGDFSINNISRRTETDIRSGVFQVYLGLGL
jgi:hypothetical protein